MRRRRLVRSIAAISTFAVAGCTGSKNSIKIDYSIGVETHEAVPDEIIEHPNPQGFSWVVVQFELVTGSFDAADLIGLTQVEVGETSHFTRGVKITSPDKEILTSEQDSYQVEEGAQGEAYYRTSDEPENPEWVVEQLRNQHGSVEIQEQ